MRHFLKDLNLQVYLYHFTHYQVIGKTLYSCFHLEPIHFEHYQYNLGNDSRIKRSSNRSPFQTFMISMNKMRGADWRQWSDHAGSNLEDMGDMMIEANNKFSEAVRYLYG